MAFWCQIDCVKGHLYHGCKKRHRALSVTSCVNCNCRSHTAVCQWFDSPWNTCAWHNIQSRNNSVVLYSCFIDDVVASSCRKIAWSLQEEKLEFHLTWPRGVHRPQPIQPYSLGKTFTMTFGENISLYPQNFWWVVFEPAIIRTEGIEHHHSTITSTKEKCIAYIVSLLSCDIWEILYIIYICYIRYIRYTYISWVYLNDCLNAHRWACI